VRAGTFRGRRRRPLNNHKPEGRQQIDPPRNTWSPSAAQSPLGGPPGRDRRAVVALFAQPCHPKGLDTDL
jgi:hypothetical protein